MCPETHQDANLTASPAGVTSVPTVDALLPVERDGWVQHRDTYGHAASQMRACGACMDAMVAMRDELARRVIALEGMAAAFREYERVGREVDALRGHAPDMHAEYRRVGEAYNRFCALAEAAGERGGG